MTPETVTLRSDGGSEAQILVNGGFNLFRFQAVADGRPVPVVWSHPEFASGNGHPALSGIPILFPFGGRIAGTSFEYQGRSYPLEEGDGQGNAIHGFVLSRPWRLLQASESEATGEFQASIDDPALLKRWPGDFRIRLRYALADNQLNGEFLVENPGDSPLPFGLAAHPYFCLPSRSENAAAAIVKVPAHKQWELADLMPTGRFETPEMLERLRAGMPITGEELDCVLTELETNAGRCETSLFDPATGRRITQSFAACFRHCVVYAPPHGEAVCIEPYTAVPNPFSLEAQGIASGLRYLEPGGRFTASFAISVA